jgi:hypothetical protein
MSSRYDIEKIKREFVGTYRPSQPITIDEAQFTARYVYDNPRLLEKWYKLKYEERNAVTNECILDFADIYDAHTNTLKTEKSNQSVPTYQYYNQETKEMTDDERMINDALKFAEFDGNTLSVVKCGHSTGGTYSYLYFGDDIAEYRNCKKAVVENQNRNGFCVVDVKSFERFEDTAQRIKDGYYKFIVAFIDETVGENQREAVLTEIADMEQAMFDIRRKEFNKKVAELNEVNAANDEGETE